MHSKARIHGLLTADEIGDAIRNRTMMVVAGGWKLNSQPNVGTEYDPFKQAGLMFCVTATKVKCTTR
jgi:hypothetical protein